LQKGKKIGGILVEERQNKLMLGIGINLQKCPASGQTRQGGFPAGTLDINDNNLKSINLWLDLVRRAGHWYLQILACPVREFLDSLLPHLAFMGQKIRVDNNRESISGILSGLHDDGSLVLRQGNQQIFVASGSISGPQPAQ
jgi:BirA family biotin operon repressor/biotin-[acetyl-CoA-carboxylase] ligase